MSKAPEFAADDGHIVQQPRGHTESSAPLQGLKVLHFDIDWITRPVFGLGLAAIAIGSVAAGGYYFAGVVCILAIAAAREWHRMVGNPVFAREIYISAVTLALAFAALALSPKSLVPWLVIAAGMLVAFVSAQLRGARAGWQAAGIAYIAVPSLLVVAMRDLAPQGAWLVAGFMLAVWSTDTGALVAGNLIGGAKLAPVLSPNKTWSGTLGGVVTAAAIEAIYVGVLGGSPLLGAAYGSVIAAVAHAGDLFESWVKRRFHVKDSGGLIPGHGGVLDRVDSTLSAGLVLAIAVFVFDFDPLFGAHP